LFSDVGIGMAMHPNKKIKTDKKELTLWNPHNMEENIKLVQLIEEIKRFENRRNI